MAPREPPPKNLELFIRRLIPKELIPSNWKCNRSGIDSNIKSLYFDGRSKLIMFKSADQLIEEFKEYLTTSTGYLGTDPSANIEPSRRKVCYYTVDISKVFKFLPDSTEVPLEGRTLKIARMILKECWNKIKMEATHHKMICPYSLADSKFTVPKYPAPPVDGNYRELITDFDIHWNRKIGGMSKVISDWVNNYETINIGEGNLTEDLAVAAEYVGSVMQQVANYGKNKDIPFPPLNTVKKSKAFIRVFPVGSDHYVMANEFIKYCESQKINVEELKKEIIGKPELTTFPYKKIRPMLENKEVVIMNNQRLLTFAQKLIPIYGGEYCILAADALYGLLMDMIAAKRVFQHIQASDWERIMTFFEAIELYFDENEGVYFFDTKDLHVIKTMWEHVYVNQMESNNTSKDQTNPDEKKTGEVYNIYFDHLGLDTYFKNIRYYATPIAESLIDSGGVYTKYSIALSIIRCQINCLVRKVPWMLKFIHNQKSCKRMYIESCEHCIMEKDNEKLSKLQISKKNQSQGGASKRKK